MLTDSGGSWKEGPHRWTQETAKSRRLSRLAHTPIDKEAEADGEVENDGEEDGEEDGQEDIRDSVAEDEAAGRGGERFSTNSAEQHWLLQHMTEEKVSHMSQKAPEFSKPCRKITRAIRNRVPTSKELKKGKKVSGCFWRPAPAAKATAKTIINVRRKLPGMKGEVMFGGKPRCLQRRTNGKDGRAAKYAMDCAVTVYFSSKRNKTSSSSAPAEKSKSKASADRLSAKAALKARNEAFKEEREKKENEKKERVAKRNERAKSMLLSVKSLAEGQKTITRI